MRLLTIFCLLFSFGLMAKDYKSLQRLNEGDVISAEVFNDILDRIELSLKSTTAADLLGSWDVVQTICPDGGLGNCSELLVTGTTSAVDNLFRQRLDTVTFSDDGDGTYSFQTTSYCAFVRSGAGNSPCAGGYAIVDGRFILNSSGFAAYTLKKISDTRIVLGMNASGSASYNIIRLDKKNLPPEPPANLIATNSSGTISLSWDAVVATETFLVDGSTPVKQSEGAASSYKIQSKDAADGTYTDLATATTNSYTDTITSGTTRWYRVYAVNEYGTSKGSNVVSISYSE
jgi:hypothetical protein